MTQPVEVLATKEFFARHGPNCGEVDFDKPEAFYRAACMKELKPRSHRAKAKKKRKLSTHA